MSGSRAIVLRLSVAGADEVRQALHQAGEQGERALQRLDAAAKQATGGSGASGGGGFTGMRNAIGQAGFQLQDFAVQVQGGTSALTALSQQGSQLLGVFGPTGAIAGAALTVGILAAQLLGLGKGGEDASKGIEDFTKSMEASARTAEQLIGLLQRVEARFLSISERARLGSIRDITSDIGRLNAEGATAAFRLADRDMAARTARNRVAGLTEQIEQGFANGLSGNDIEGLRAQIREQTSLAESAEGDAAELRRVLTRLDFEINRSEGLILGLVSGDSNSNPGRFEEPRGGGARATGPDEISRMVQRNVAAAGARSLEEAKREMADFGQETRRTSDLGRELGLTFSSAFEDAIVKGKSLRDVVGGLAQDVARITVRQTITAPLGNALSSLIGGFFGGGGGPTKGLSPTPGPSIDVTGIFANGGVMTSGGPLALRRFSSGGIADSPQLALYGEGSMPEAYVPLPDGRSIPVNMRGGGNVTVIINAQGAGPREIDILRAQIGPMAVAAVQDATRRGGSPARNIRGR